MEIEEIEAVLEKIWDLHDKLSDAIHTISRSHFLKTTLHHTKPNFDFKKSSNNNNSNGHNNNNDVNRNGFVFVKDFIPADADGDSAISEAKSLNSIRTALENLEDQLEFFHTVQVQQQAERDAAIAQLEQSRIVLAMRLAEHQGKKYKVIEEARAFVGDVHNTACLVSPHVLNSSTNPSGEKCVSDKGKKPNALIKALLSTFNFAKSSLRLDHIGGVFGNAALLAFTMIALLHLQQVSDRDNRSAKRSSRLEGDSPLTSLDVLSARG
ncbi:hypothetical protein RJ641_007661 [Dillenia turbinata]|uniref:Plastid division protein PDV1 n=1 Tax=Dillenia turbinata TaxID=194707 RepID=A0AAN8VAR1_9MAGN